MFVLKCYNLYCVLHSIRRDVCLLKEKLEVCGILIVGFCVNNSGVLILVLEFSLCGDRETSLKLNNILCDLDLFFV